MRSSAFRCIAIGVVVAALSGCYSNGRWSMPDLAFWKSNPLSSTAASEAPPAAPVRPAEVAANPPTAPTVSGGYAIPGTGAPPTVSYPGTPASYTMPGGGVAEQVPYPYPSTQNTPAVDYGTANSTSPYMAPQQGYYGQGAAVPPSAYAAVPPTSSEGAYPSTGVPPYDPSAFAPPASQPPYGNYAHPQPASAYLATNPVRTPPSYGTEADRYGGTPAADTGYGAGGTAYGGTPPGSSASLVGDRYAPPAPASNYNYGSTGYTPPASDYRPGATGYIPPGMTPYAPPAGSYVPPTNASGELPPYRPGSTSDYAPANTAPTSTIGSPPPAGISQGFRS